MVNYDFPIHIRSIHAENETFDYYLGTRRKQHHLRDHHHHNHRMLSTNYLPDSVDWRDEGAVNRHKSQGNCGSCWAFSTTGAIEGQYFRKTGKLIRFSEQNLVDCVSGCGCSGCDLPEVYRYVRDNGIETEFKYDRSYIAEDAYCRSNSSNAINITGFKRIPEGDEGKLCEAIATVGPVSISIDADHESLMHYSSGIYYEPNCSSYRLNHAVLVVGYGKNENGEEYYIVQNW